MQCGFGSADEQHCNGDRVQGGGTTRRGVHILRLEDGWLCSGGDCVQHHELLLLHDLVLHELHCDDSWEHESALLLQRNAAADGSAYDVRAFVGAQLSAHERPAEHHAHPRTIHRADCDA